MLAMPMGTGGVGLAWRQAHETLGAPAAVGEVLLAFTLLLWLAMVSVQALRALRYPEAVTADLRHPVRLAFGAAPTIGLMIISAFLHRYQADFGRVLWGLAVALHLLFAMGLLRRILLGRLDTAVLVPPLMIPLVGNILAPVFGVPMGFVEASWMMFGVGLLLWLAVLPLLLHRIVAGPPLPPTLRPSLVILLAPPAVGALALVALLGEPGGASLTLVGIALLVAAVLVSLARHLAAIPFGLPWWSVTFPSAAFAAMLMAEGFGAWLCWLALAATTGLTAWVAARTAQAALAGAFFRPEG